MEMTAEYEALRAVMRNVDPATWPGLSLEERAALGRYAKPHVDVQAYCSDKLTIQQKAVCFDILARGVRDVKLNVDGCNDNCYPENTERGLLKVVRDIDHLENYDPDAEEEWEGVGEGV